MLSKQAFNALLKTLEEPPPYLKFIFATTEVNKIPVTVLSRCQRFDLARVKSDEILSFLKKVIELEKQKLSDEILKLIIKISEGSVRDALSLLDRILISKNDDKSDEFSIEKAYEIFGFFEKKILIDLVKEIFKGEEESALKIYRQIYNQGVDPKNFLNNFLEIIYYIKNFKNLRKTENSINLSEKEIEEIEQLSQSIEPKSLLLFWQFSLETMEELNMVSDQNLSIEMFLIRLLYITDFKTVSISKEQNTDTNILKDLDTKLSSARTIDQLKSSTQELKSEELNKQKIEIKSFNNLIDICNKKKEIKLKYDLENNVSLVNFRNKHIEISIDGDLSKDFIKILSSKLFDWTNDRWIITLSQKTGMKTIREKKDTKLKKDKEEFKKTEIFKDISEAFPDIEIVEKKDE